MAGVRVGPRLRRFRGDTMPHSLTVYEDGVAKDITGWSFLMTLNTDEDPVGGTPALTVQFTGVITVAASGQFTIGPANATEADQSIGTYFYDLQVTDASGNILTTWKNTYTFHQDITK